MAWRPRSCDKCGQTFVTQLQWYNHRDCPVEKRDKRIKELEKEILNLKEELNR